MVTQQSSLGAEETPAIPVMLRRTTSGPRLESLLEDYRLLRRTEAQTRWVAGRAIDALDVGRPEAAVVAELMEPGLTTAGLEQQVREAQCRVRAAYDGVLTAGTIDVLGE